jgi:Domain of unknown function (DUF4291)
MPDPSNSTRQVRALFDAETIRVYQAYRDEIADAALAAGRFVPPFRRSRMTWIKPSFLWMMYRCGWTEKEAGQRRVLAIDLSRAGFESALRQACPSDETNPTARKAHVRVQWDPERDLYLRRLPMRSLQVGLSGPAIAAYADEWTVRLSEVTELAKTIREHLRRGERLAAEQLLPAERHYPLPLDVAERIGAHG